MSDREIEIRSAAPMFLVADVNATANWYVDKLGFEIAGIFPRTGPPAWASIMRGGAEIMLQRLAGHRKESLYDRRPGGVWDAYIRMRGVSELYAKVSRGVTIKMPLRKQPYGDWEFEVQDLNGYVLVFGGDEDR
ncbi:MAG TPA: VOC family protein [Gemmatimonadaceae bacterium]|nr:VOC family protein [Gemmatimonadaceae bacterium]